MTFYLQLFGISLLLTLVLELGLAFLIKVRGKSLIPVLLVNILTNPPVVLLCFLFNIDFPMQLLPEVLVVLVEGGIYYLFNAREGYEIRRPFLKALILNGFSYFVGMLINRFFL